MPIVRWLMGFWRVLFGMWDTREFAYYQYSGLDPKLPAFQRWQALLKDKPRAPTTEAERVVPIHDYTVVLEDKLGFAPEEVIMHTQNAGQAQALHEEYEKELRSRSAGDFWYSMIRLRRLDFFHIPPPLEEESLEEGGEVDEDAFREMFRRDREE